MRLPHIVHAKNLALLSYTISFYVPPTRIHLIKKKKMILYCTETFHYVTFSVMTNLLCIFRWHWLEFLSVRRDHYAKSRFKCSFCIIGILWHIPYLLTPIVVILFALTKYVFIIELFANRASFRHLTDKLTFCIYDSDQTFMPPMWNYSLWPYSSL